MGACPSGRGVFPPIGQCQDWWAGSGRSLAPPQALWLALGAGVLGETPLSSLLPTRTPTFVGGVVVGHGSPPVPAKLAEKIWRSEYIDLNMLLPHRLGAPEPTLTEVLQMKSREEKFKVVAFKTLQYYSVNLTYQRIMHVIEMKLCVIEMKLC